MVKPSDTLVKLLQNPPQLSCLSPECTEVQRLRSSRERLPGGFAGPIEHDVNTLVGFMYAA